MTSYTTMKPLLVEFAGTPNSGKDQVIRTLANHCRTVLQRDTRVVDEAYKSVPSGKGLDVDLLYRTIAITVARLYEAKIDGLSGSGIALVNRGIFDRLAFVELLRSSERITDKQAQIHSDYLLSYTHFVSAVFVLIVSPATSLLRETEERRLAPKKQRPRLGGSTKTDMMNEQTLALLNRAYEKVGSFYAHRFDHFVTLHTDQLDCTHVTQTVAEYLSTCFRTQ